MRLFLFAFCLIAFAACSSGPEPADLLHVEEVVYREMPGGARIVTGTLVNDGDAAVPGAQVQLSLFDADNRRVGQMMVVVRDVPPRDSVAFREPVRDREDVRGVRVRNIIVL
jgi:hypothetical protein